MAVLFRSGPELCGSALRTTDRSGNKSASLVQAKPVGSCNYGNMLLPRFTTERFSHCLFLCVVLQARPSSS